MVLSLGKNCLKIHTNSCKREVVALEYQSEMSINGSKKLLGFKCRPSPMVYHAFWNFMTITLVNSSSMIVFLFMEFLNSKMMCWNKQLMMIIKYCLEVKLIKIKMNSSKEYLMRTNCQNCMWSPLRIWAYKRIKSYWNPLTLMLKISNSISRKNRTQKTLNLFLNWWILDKNCFQLIRN